MVIRPLSPEDDIPTLTRLLHRAYQPLAALGLNFTAADQSDDTTRHRLSAPGTITLLAQQDGQIVGLVTAHNSDGCLLYRQPGARVIGPLAVDPAVQGRGIGAALISSIIAHERENGTHCLALDTAESLSNLIALYSRHGFRLAGHHQWSSKHYRSILMALWLQGPVVRPILPADVASFVEAVRLTFLEYGFTWEPEAYHADLYGLPDSYPDGFWVAEHEGQVMGGGGLHAHPLVPGQAATLIQTESNFRVAGTDAEIVRVYVHPSARRLGLGRALSRIILNEAYHRGFAALEVWSDKQYDKAHALYQSLGAQLVGDRICNDPDQSPEWGFFWPVPPRA